jgi:hypothetical protein
MLYESHVNDRWSVTQQTGSFRVTTFVDRLELLQLIAPLSEIGVRW